MGFFLLVFDGESLGSLAVLVERVRFLVEDDGDNGDDEDAAVSPAVPSVVLV